jgi:hypothetical protein
MNHSGGILIVLDANTIGVDNKESPVPAGRIKKAVPRLSDHPSNERRDNVTWGVERTE